jgi:hypothetical protein
MFLGFHAAFLIAGLVYLAGFLAFRQVVRAGEKPSVQHEPGRGRRYEGGPPVRVAFADTDAMGVA